MLPPMTKGKNSQAAEEIAAHLTKNRIVAVDIVRILAAFSVMYGHLAVLPGGGRTAALFATWRGMTIGMTSTIFFVLAGYFACRNITWKKGLVNAWWCFAPLLLWNVITALMASTYDPEVLGKVSWGALTGISRLHYLTWEIGGPSGLLDSPLWFMRDLIFLFLLSPLLFKWARWLFPTLFFFSLFQETGGFFLHSAGYTLSLYSITFFTFGCFLRTFSRDVQKQILTYHSPKLILIWVAVATAGAADAIFQATGWHTPWRVWMFAPSVMSIILLYWTARWIEVRLPWATPLALKLAPVTFLTFAAHWPIYLCAKHYLPAFCKSCFAMSLPFVIFALMAVFFFALKRWFPAALHLVAHYKIRPDDVVKGRTGAAEQQ